MRIYDQEGLERALSDLHGPSSTRPSQLDLEKVRRRRRGLYLSFAGVFWSVSVFGGTCFFGPSLPRRYILPMPLFAFGALAYVLAAHSDGYRTAASFAASLRVGAEFWSEVARTIGRIPRWAIVLCLACIGSLMIPLVATPPRSHAHAVQDQQGYWLEDNGVKVRPMTEKEFRNFDEGSDRPVALLCFDLSLMAAIGFAYGPDSARGPET